ncbi:unnamed protein product [Auanema sp. JU1783]|nr:unnamed protein product [Auanema sp. JU1783]
MHVPLTDSNLQSFTLLPDERQNITSRRLKRAPINIARMLVGLEVILSLSFHIAMWISAKKGHWIHVVLATIVGINLVAAARLLTRLRGTNAASPITVYLVWKMLQEVTIVPVLVVFTFIMLEGYIKSWANPTTAIQVLIVVWIYAAYSFYLIIYLCRLARLLWKRKEEKRRNSINSTISIITQSFDTNTGGDMEIPN